MVVSQTSSPSSPMGGRRLIPAQLTRMSGSPKAATAPSAAARTPSAVPRSALTQAVRHPAASNSSMVAFSSLSRRATTTTRAPARASAPVTARPIPELPPVTTATRPASENRSET